jgi:phosphotransferase system  glucose/maltose/N-acetylglucosamine-specific IIC component
MILNIILCKINICNFYNIYMIEVIIASVLIVLFYFLTQKNNIMLFTPSDEKMANVNYYVDDINGSCK